MLLSLVCPTVLVNMIYGNTIKARSQTPGNKHNPVCEMSFIFCFLSFSMKKETMMLN